MNKFKNNLLFKNILILLISGGIAKVIGMIGKIIYTRVAGVNIVSLYALITPTLMLIITITQFSLPISISKLSAEGKYKDNALIKNAYILSFLVDIILMALIVMSSKIIANMLHNSELYKAILSVIVILPFISISSVQRGFLHGKEDMMPAGISNVVEEVVKIILIILILPLFVSKGNIVSIICIILFNVITETISILIMNKEIKKKYKLKKAYINKNILKDIISISLPTTSVRLISSVGFFLEPIILTNILLKTGYNSNYITLEYGIINSYIIPLLSVPSFFSISIASALLPNITKSYASKRYNEFNSKLIKLMILSIVVGFICLIFIMIIPRQILTIIYNIDYGINYIYLIGPFFLILYMQPTLSVAMQAMNKTNKLFIVSIVSIIIKYFILIITGLMNNGMNSLIYSIITGIIITTSMMLFIILKELKKKDT